MRATRGGERIASKVDPEWLGQAPTLYYHPDLLGSTHYVTNDEQELVQHAEYFPGGELWADEVNGSYQQRRPAYLFTGKELDEATGLYDYGARYYDARQGQWLSPDPALGDYVTGELAGGLYAPHNSRKSRRAHPMAGPRPCARHPPQRERGDEGAEGRGLSRPGPKNPAEKSVRTNFWWSTTAKKEFGLFLGAQTPSEKGRRLIFVGFTPVQK